MLVRLPAQLLRGQPGGPVGEEEWQATLEELVLSFSDALQPEFAPQVEVAASDDGLAVTIDARPALLDQSISRSPEKVLEKVTQCLIRRPEMLSAESSRTASVQAYLADLGLAPGRADFADGRHGADAAIHQIAEDVIDNLQPDEITIEGPPRVLRRATAKDFDLVSRLRHQNLFEYGLAFPDLRLRPTTADDIVRLRLNDLRVPLHGLGPDSAWSDVVEALVGSLRLRTHWFLRQRDVESSLNDLGYLMPDLVQSCLDSYPLSTVTAVLREIARSSRSIRNLGRLVWLLLDVGGSEAEAGADRFAFTETPRHPRRRRRLDQEAVDARADDPVVLTALVRKALNEEYWRIGASRAPNEAGRLSADTEELLVAASGGADLAALADAEWRALSEVSELGHPTLLVVRAAAAIPPVASCAQALPNPPRVLSSQELPPDVDLATIPVAGRRSLTRT